MTDLRDAVEELSAVLARTGIKADPKKPDDAEGAGEEVDRLTRELMASTSLSYSQASDRVLMANPKLKARYAREPWLTRELAPCDPTKPSAGLRVHSLVQSHMRSTGGKSYAAALDDVLAADPALKRAFAQSGGL